MLSHCRDRKQSMAYVVLRPSGRPLPVFLFTLFLSQSPAAGSRAFSSGPISTAGNEELRSGNACLASSCRPSDVTTFPEKRSFPVDDISRDDMQSLKVILHRDFA